ncbi:MAG: lytic transglycosylase domain-containing protein [Lachnospiraceae bacterium]
MNVTAIQNETAARSQKTQSTGSTQNSSFSSYLNKDATLDTYFTKASETYGVPKALLEAITMQESSFNPKATSHCGAQGLMQLMPATARSLGVTDAYDPEQNIMGGAKYISQLLNQYNGDVKLALAAYNAGSNNVAKYGGVPPFKETQDYVVKVMGYYQQGVDVPNMTFSSGSSTISAHEFVGPEEPDPSTVAEPADRLLQMFSYEDYLRFINLFTMSEEQENNDEKEEQNENLSAGVSALQHMQYSRNVLAQFQAKNI